MLFSKLLTDNSNTSRNSVLVVSSMIVSNSSSITLKRSLNVVSFVITFICVYYLIILLCKNVINSCNSIWFKNILNTTIPESNTRTNFTAEVEVVGGTGKYSGVKGSGVVIGYFDPSSGIGKSTTSAKISFRKGEKPEKKDKDDDHKSEENH